MFLYICVLFYPYVFILNSPVFEYTGGYVYVFILSYIRNTLSSYLREYSRGL